MWLAKTHFSKRFVMLLITNVNRSNFKEKLKAPTLYHFYNLYYPNRFSKCRKNNKLSKYIIESRRKYYNWLAQMDPKSVDIFAPDIYPKPLNSWIGIFSWPNLKEIHNRTYFLKSLSLFLNWFYQCLVKCKDRTLFERQYLILKISLQFLVWEIGMTQIATKLDSDTKRKIKIA